MNGSNHSDQSIAREKLNSASFHISSNWLPFNLELVDQISQKLTTNYYENRKDELLEDLKSDIALFTYSIKEIALNSRIKIKSIYDSIRACEADNLKRILDKLKAHAANHKLATSSKSQLNQLNANITGNAITETLASACDAETELAFLSSLFRQIGLTFIAWNYPHIFENCLKTTNNEEEFLEHLNRALGFSPAMLGIRLAKEWQIPSSIINILNLGLEENPANAEDPSAVILKLCRIGETLASLNNENFAEKPSVAWNQARNEILRHLGSKGFKLIEDNINKLAKHYMQVLPNSFPNDLHVKIEEFSKSPSNNSLYHSNAYIQFINSDAQLEMRDFYDTFSPEGLSKESVDFLCSNLVPSLGFTNGALFLVDPISQTLMPRLSFGGDKISNYPVVNLNSEGQQSTILKAFNSSNPIAIRETDDGYDVINSFYGALGSIQRTGVLFLRTGNELRKSDKVNPALYFRALLRALEDCLMLR